MNRVTIVAARWTLLASRVEQANIHGYFEIFKTTVNYGSHREGFQIPWQTGTMSATSVSPP